MTNFNIKRDSTIDASGRILIYSEDNRINKDRIVSDSMSLDMLVFSSNDGDKKYDPDFITIDKDDAQFLYSAIINLMNGKTDGLSLEAGSNLSHALDGLITSIHGVASRDTDTNTSKNRNNTITQEINSPVRSKYHDYVKQQCPDGMKITYESVSGSKDTVIDELYATITDKIFDYIGSSSNSNLTPIKHFNIAVDIADISMQLLKLTYRQYLYSLGVKKLDLDEIQYNHLIDILDVKKEKFGNYESVLVAKEVTSKNNIICEEHIQDANISEISENVLYCLDIDDIGEYDRDGLFDIEDADDDAIIIPTSISLSDTFDMDCNESNEELLHDAMSLEDTKSAAIKDFLGHNN